MNAFLQTLLSGLAAVTIDNVIFTAAIGTSTLIECAKAPKHLLSFGFFITEFSVLSSCLTYFAEKQIVSETARLFLPSVYILCLGLVYVLTLIVMRIISKEHFKSLRKYVHMSAFNCAVLGCIFINGESGAALPERLMFAAEVGIGFIFATYLLAINYKKLSSEDVPASFRGFPASLLYIGILAMIVYGLKI